MNTNAFNLDVGNKAKPLRFTPRLAAGIAVLTLASPLLVWADCVDMRKPTAAETDFHNRAWAALVAALPPVPVGAEAGRSHQDSVRLPAMGQKCADEKIGDFEVSVQRAYEINSKNRYYDQSAEVRVTMNVRRFPTPDKHPSGAYGSPSAGRSSGLRVHNIVWSVTGTDTPLRRAVAGALDRARLEAMIGKPLPTVAQSQAFAAAAVPATVEVAPVAAPAAAAAPPPNSPATQSSSVAAQPGAPAAPAQPAPSDPTRDAIDTVNRLRGLFGR